MRFASIYTAGGGTLANSQAMAARAAGWFSAPVVEDDATPGGAMPDDELEHGLLFKYTTWAHDDVPRQYFEPLLATSSIR
jgi:hypothetical protein